MPASRTLLARLNEPDEAVETRMIRELDALLGDPPRIELPAGTVVFHEADAMEGVYILINGQVELFKDMDGREIIFHAQTAGRILGLLALTQLSRAFFTCRTTSPVTLVKIRFEDLDRALQESDSLLVAFITVLMRSMARRSKRLVELQTEVLTLNQHLATERDALARTLRELRQAQSLLVESEKLATLGQLAAGVAHELNNPIAAITRAADFIQQDLQQLAAELPDGAVFRTMLDRARSQKPLATRAQRDHRRELARRLETDEETAGQLVQMGIYDAGEFERLAHTLSGDRAAQIERLHHYHQIGGALRNIAHCADRIGGLVRSLRAYSRPDDTEMRGLDLHEGLEDTLRLFGNRLRDVTVERQWGELPPVTGNPGELNQVWTNLIANALDAMQDRGRLTIATGVEENLAVVRIIDSGPGIPAEHLQQVFDLHFTTRQGRVEFGLGLGLSIAQHIVTRHGGRIDVSSEPGRTAFSVCIPIGPPASMTPSQGARKKHE